MKKSIAGVAAAVVVASAGVTTSSAADAGGYNATMRADIASRQEGARVTTYTAKYTVSNTTNKTQSATVTSPTVPGLSCTVRVRARSSASCTVTVKARSTARLLAIKAASNSNLKFAPTTRAVGRQIAFPDYCLDRGSDYWYFDCGDPAQADVDLGRDYTDRDPDPIRAGVPRDVYIAIDDWDWQRGFYADITSPRFAKNSGWSQNEGYQKIRPGQRLDVHHMMGEPYIYKVVVIPTKEEEKKGYMDIPVTLTSVNGTVYQRTAQVS